jgi:hypothetical protein
MDVFPLARRQVRDKAKFSELLYLYNCKLIDQDRYYYYIEGTGEDLEQLFIHVEMEQK